MILLDNKYTHQLYEGCLKRAVIVNFLRKKVNISLFTKNMVFKIFIILSKFITK